MNRTRPKQIVIRVSEEELAQIKEKVEQSGKSQQQLIRTFSGVCRNSRDSSQKRGQCRSSIRTTLRYDSVIHTLNLKAFPPAGRQISKK